MERTSTKNTILYKMDRMGLFDLLELSKEDHSDTKDIFHIIPRFNFAPMEHINFDPTNEVICFIKMFYAVNEKTTGRNAMVWDTNDYPKETYTVYFRNISKDAAGFSNVQVVIDYIEKDVY